MKAEDQQGIPEKLAQDLAGRDQTSLGRSTFLKYQFISLAPGSDHNFRYHIKQDGRLFFAANTKGSSEAGKDIFTSNLPAHHNRILTEEILNTIRTLVQETGFFNQPVYQAAPVRDGSLAIVTVRMSGQVHEVWYVNTHNDLTDFLHKIGPVATEKSKDDPPANFERLLQEQQALSKKLQKGSSDLEPEDHEPA